MAKAAEVRDTGNEKREVKLGSLTGWSGGGNGAEIRVRIAGADVTLGTRGSELVIAGPDAALAELSRLLAPQTHSPVPPTSPPDGRPPLPLQAKDTIPGGVLR